MCLPLSCKTCLSQNPIYLPTVFIQLPFRPGDISDKFQWAIYMGIHASPSRIITSIQSTCVWHKPVKLACATQQLQKNLLVWNAFWIRFAFFYLNSICGWNKPTCPDQSRPIHLFQFIFNFFLLLFQLFSTCSFYLEAVALKQCGLSSYSLLTSCGNYYCQPDQQ